MYILKKTVNIVNTEIKNNCNSNCICMFYSFHLVSIPEPVLKDHLSFKTTFSGTMGWSYKTGLTVQCTGTQAKQHKELPLHMQEGIAKSELISRLPENSIKQIQELHFLWLKDIFMCQHEELNLQFKHSYKSYVRVK